MVDGSAVAIVELFKCSTSRRALMDLGIEGPQYLGCFARSESVNNFRGTDRGRICISVRITGGVRCSDDVAFVACREWEFV